MQMAKDEDRRWYLGVLLHALNQPLTALASYVEAAESGLGPNVDPLVREALSAAREECLRAIAVSRELRAVIGRRGDREPGELDVAAVLEELAPELPVEAGVRVRLELVGTAATVRGDALTLRRALIALVKSIVATLEDAGDVTAVLRSLGAESPAQVELELQLDGPAGVAFPRVGQSDPLASLARSALADLGAELILVASEPTSLRFQLRLALA